MKPNFWLTAIASAVNVAAACSLSADHVWIWPFNAGLAALCALVAIAAAIRDA